MKLVVVIDCVLYLSLTYSVKISFKISSRLKTMFNLFVFVVFR